MPTYVSCHGELSSSRPQTFVPRYIPRVMYFSKAGEILSQSNEMGLLARADIGLTDPTDSYAAGDPIPNYELAPNSDRDAAISTYFEPSGHDLYFIPRDMSLCMADGTDDQGQAQPCADGVHYCSGLFGTLAWSDTRLQDELVMLSCRGIVGRTNAHTREIGSDTSDTYTRDAVDDFGILWRSKDDTAKAELWDGLPEGTRLTMLALPSVDEWVEVRKARGLLESDGALALHAYYFDDQQADYRTAFDKDPQIDAALDEAEDTVTWFVDADDSTRRAYWGELSEADRQYLCTRDPVIQDWVDTKDVEVD